VTADGVTVNGMRMPGKSPTAVDVAVALANPDHERREQRQLADVRPDSGPKLITAPREDVLEIGLEPPWQLAAEPRALGGQIKAEQDGRLGECAGPTLKRRSASRVPGLMKFAAERQRQGAIAVEQGVAALGVETESGVAIRNLIPSGSLSCINDRPSPRPRLPDRGSARR